jgi:hypothetical protein
MNAKRVRLVATARFVHDGRWVYPGVNITAGEDEAADLCALGFASRAADVEKKSPKIAPETIFTRDSVAEEGEDEKDSEDTLSHTSAPVSRKPRRKSAYKRRDMRAEN